MSRIPLLNVTAAQEGDESAVRHLFAQLAGKLDNLDPAELELLRDALRRMSDGVDARQAFIVGRPKRGPKPSERWQRDYALWAAFDALAFEHPGVTRESLFKKVADQNQHTYDTTVKALDVETVRRAVIRIEKAWVEHDRVSREDGR
jgi:hypothetical protein